MDSKEFKYTEIKNFINGKFLSSNNITIDVVSPLNGKVITSVEISTKVDVDNAVIAAKNAFQSWSKMQINERVKIFSKYKVLLGNNIDELADLIHNENGKTISEAKAEVERCINLVEFTCSLPPLVAGEIQKENENTEYCIERKAIGVVGAITPFNFPVAVPHFIIPNALVLGNCLIFKPSKQSPLTISKIAILLQEAGLPDGVFNIVNGDKDIVDVICDHSDIAAISFIGSSKVAKYVYKRATSNLKRCLALGGAKNHTILLPDANPELSAETIAKAMCECAGQRCLAPSVLVTVGEVENIIQNISDEAEKFIPGINMGPLVSIEAKNRIIKSITEAENQGARVILDGRKKISASEGYYLGPTIIDCVQPEMNIAKEEVFGPVLSIIRVNDLDTALAIANSSLYGNVASVFTQNNVIANHVMENINAGMVGLNICIPSPKHLFSFGGINQSKFGVCDINGKSSIEFWTILKKTYKAL